jgi:hypothetical protein
MFRLSANFWPGAASAFFHHTCETEIPGGGAASASSIDFSD